MLEEWQLNRVDFRVVIYSTITTVGLYGGGSPREGMAFGGELVEKTATFLVRSLSPRLECFGMIASWEQNTAQING